MHTDFIPQIHSLMESSTNVNIFNKHRPTFLHKYLEKEMFVLIQLW